MTLQEMIDQLEQLERELVERDNKAYNDGRILASEYLTAAINGVVAASNALKSL